MAGKGVEGYRGIRGVYYKERRVAAKWPATLSNIYEIDSETTK